MLRSSIYPVRKTVKRLWLGVIALLLLSGCVVKLVYNQLDWLIPWYLDDYVTLDSQQQQLFDARLQEYLDWHRRHQLPVYAEFLDRVADDASDGFSASELEFMLSRFEVFSNELVARLPAALVDILVSLNDEQVAEMFDKFERDNRRYTRRYVERSEFHQRLKREEEIQRFIERWTGELDELQVEMIERWAKKYQLMGHDFIASRKSWQQRLARVLEQRQQREQLASSLDALFSERGAHRSPQHQRRYLHNEALLKALYLDIDASLSSYQRTRMVRKLQAYAGDFRELSQQ